MKKQTLKEFLKYSRNNTQINIYYENLVIFQGDYKELKKECKALFGEFVYSWDACDFVYSDGSGEFTQVDISIEGNLLGATWDFTEEDEEIERIWKKL